MVIGSRSVFIARLFKYIWWYIFISFSKIWSEWASDCCLTQNDQMLQLFNDENNLYTMR